jgi:hypothetical protein
MDLPLFLEKKWRKKPAAPEKSPENAASFTEGIELSPPYQLYL